MSQYKLVIKAAACMRGSSLMALCWDWSYLFSFGSTQVNKLSVWTSVSVFPVTSCFGPLDLATSSSEPLSLHRERGVLHIEVVKLKPRINTVGSARCYSAMKPQRRDVAAKLSVGTSGEQVTTFHFCPSSWVRKLQHNRQSSRIKSKSCILCMLFRQCSKPFVLHWKKTQKVRFL